MRLSADYGEVIAPSGTRQTKSYTKDHWRLTILLAYCLLRELSARTTVHTYSREKNCRQAPLLLFDLAVSRSQEQCHLVSVLKKLQPDLQRFQGAKV